MVRLDDAILRKLRRWFSLSALAAMLVLVATGLGGFVGLQMATEPVRQAYLRTELIAMQIVRAQEISQLARDMSTATRIGEVFRIRSELTQALTELQEGHMDLINGNPDTGLNAIDDPDQRTLLIGTASSLDLALGDVSRTLNDEFLDEVAVPPTDTIDAVKDRIRFDITPKLERLKKLHGGAAETTMIGLVATQFAVGLAFAASGLIIWAAIHMTLARQTFLLLRPDTSEEEERMLRTLDPASLLPDAGFLIERIVEHRDLHFRQDGLSVLVVLRLANIDLLFGAEHDRNRRATVQRQVLSRLSLMVSAGDSVASLGPDAFAILRGPLPDREAIEPTVQGLLDLFDSPIAFDGEEVEVTPAIGLTTVTRLTRNPNQPIVEATAACNLARTVGIGPIVAHHPHIARYPDHADSMGQEIGEALEADDVDVLYDPIWNIETSALHRLVVSATITHKMLGRLLPGEFESMAWATGNGKPMLRKMAIAALETRAQLDGKGQPTAPVLLRVPALSVTEPGLIDALKWAVDTAGATPDSLSIWITGAGPDFAASSDVVATLHELSSAGFGLFLGRAPLTDMKVPTQRDIGLSGVAIDRAAIANIDDAPSLQLAMTTITRNFASGKAELFCDGVETAAERESLIRLGLTLMRGPYFGAPQTRGGLAFRAGAQEPEAVADAPNADPANPLAGDIRRTGSFRS